MNSRPAGDFVTWRNAEKRLFKRSEIQVPRTWFLKHPHKWQRLRKQWCHLSLTGKQARKTNCRFWVTAQRQESHWSGRVHRLKHRGVGRDCRPCCTVWGGCQDTPLTQCGPGSSKDKDRKGLGSSFLSSLSARLLPRTCEKCYTWKKTGWLDSIEIQY